VAVKTMHRARGVIDPAMAAGLAESLTEKDLARPDLRSTLASRAASKVAAVPEVRRALLEFQRRFARREGGAVLDGRDIATVICPQAEVKLFVTADDRTRAERRYNELKGKGAETSLEQVLADLKSRDRRDSERADAPMVRAPDAVLLDTTRMSIGEAVSEAVKLVRERLEQAVS
jgi:cytidylate kinase